MLGVKLSGVELSTNLMTPMLTSNLKLMTGTILACNILGTLMAPTSSISNLLCPFKATTAGSDLSMKMGNPASQGPRPSTSKGLIALVISNSFFPVKIEGKLELEYWKKYHFSK